MGYFKTLILHYLRCLLRTTVTARHALTWLSDCTPLLHVMYECMRWTYFSLPRHDPQRRLLEKNLNYPRETTGPCQARAEGRRKSGERQRKRGAERGRWDGAGKDAKERCLTVLLIPHTAASASVHLIGIQSREGSMRVSVARRGSCCLSPALLNLHCWPGIDWRTSKRDRHTVTGKMNCHLAFLKRLAASNWPLWTMWRDTDWVLPPPPSCLLQCTGSPCQVCSRRGGHQYLGAESVTLHQSLVGFSILPRHPSLFHCAASLLWLSASLVFLMAHSHGTLTGQRRSKTIRGSHLDPGGNPRVY